MANPFDDIGGSSDPFSSVPNSSDPFSSIPVSSDPFGDLPQRGAGILDQIKAGTKQFIGSGQIASGVTALENLEDPFSGVDLNNLLLRADLSVNKRLAPGEVITPEERENRVQEYLRSRQGNRKEDSLSKINRGFKNLEEARKIPFSSSTSKVLTASSFGEAFDEFTKEPITVIKEIGARSLPNSIPIVVGSGIGSLAGGPVGSAGVGGAVSFSIERANRIVEGLQKAGIDIGNSEEVLQAVQNPELMQKVKNDALIGAAAVGALDVVTLGIAGKTLAPSFLTSNISRHTSNISAQLVVQGAGGAGGEALAQKLTEGKIESPGQVFAEGIGEFISAPVDVAVATITDSSRLPSNARKIVDEDLSFEDSLKFIEEAYPEEDGSSLIFRNMDLLPDQDELRRGIMLDIGVSIDDADLQPGSVAFVGFDTAERDIAYINKQIEIEQEITDSERAPFIRMRELKHFKELASEKLAHQNISFKRIHSIVSEWVRDYSPKTSIVISAGAEGIVNENFVMGHDTLGHTINLGRDTFLLGLNLDSILDTSKSHAVNQALLLETVAHEFGHALQLSLYNKQPAAVKEEVFTAYKDALKKLENKTIPLNDAIKNFESPITKSIKGFRERKYATDKMIYNNLVENLTRDSIENKEPYIYSFDEWFANQSAKFLTSNQQATKPIHEVYLRGGELLKRFWSRYHKTWGESQSFNKYMNTIAKRVRKTRVSNAEFMAQQSKTIEAKIDNSGAILTSLLHNKKIGVPKEARNNLQRSLDKYNTFLKWSTTLLQLGDLNPHIPGLQNYIGSVREWWKTKTYWNGIANERVKEWRNLGKIQSKLLSRFLLEVTQESDKKQRKLSTKELESINNKLPHPLTDESLEVFKSIQKDFSEAIGYDPRNPTGLYKVLVQDLEAKFKDNVAEFDVNFEALNEDFHQISNRNYFPLTRFGDYLVRVKASVDGKFEGKKYRAGDTILFETYTNRTDQDNRLKVLNKHLGNHIISSGVLQKETRAYIGMPQALINRIIDSEGLDLTTEQKKVLRELTYSLSPSQSYKKHLLARKGTEGFSKNSLKSYAQYFLNFSGHIARAEHEQALADSIQSITDDAKTIQDQGGNATNRGLIANHLRSHRDYIFKPVNELTNISAFSFLWYMGLNVKSAYVNLTQVPLVTYPYLAARTEINKGLPGVRDKKAVQHIVKATKDVSKSISKGVGLSDGEKLMIDTLKEEGIIDESLAMEVAGLAEGTTLQRVLPSGNAITEPLDKFIRDASYYSGYIFQVAEKFNRRVTALAGFRMAQESGSNYAEALTEARRAVAHSQFEVARWNRPQFMQGKKAVFFVFWQHLQNSLYFMAKDPGGMRFAMLLLLAGGLTALPFADSLLDLFDYTATKSKHLLGMKDPKVDLKLELRRILTDFAGEDSAHIALNGILSEYGLGPLHLLQFAGVPIPNVDLSGSVSFGDIIPGTDLLGAPRNTNISLVEGGKDISGAGLSIPVSIYQALYNKNPDDWKRFEAALPSALGNVSKAVRRVVRGGETDATGARLTDASGDIVEFNFTDGQSRGETIAQALGFTPARLSKAREFQHTRREHIIFYEVRRAKLLADYDFVRRLKDKEGITDVRNAIDKYNNSVPNDRLKISSRELTTSLTRRARSRARTETGLPKSIRNVILSRDVEEAFTDEKIR